MATALSLNKTIFTPALHQSIRDLWFGSMQWGAKTYTDEAMQRWFTGSKEAKEQFDKTCHAEFNHAITSISPSQFPIKGLSDAEIAAPFISDINAADGGGEESTKTALSFFILLDQIPRNLYRTKETLGLVYNHYDPIAASLARHIVGRDASPRLDLHPSIRHSLPYRQWFYMPLMHSERLDDHKNLGDILDQMKSENQGEEQLIKDIDFLAGFENQHLKIIERFGRYPHRNFCLGRDNTSEESEYMKSGGETFGVAG